jgi:RNA polymerase sigma-70 factor (ECF subfamily)
LLVGEVNPTNLGDIVGATPKQAFADYRNDFEGVVSRYSPVLFRVALRRLRNVEDAEDAVQEALLSAYKYIGQFEGRSQLSTWLTRIVTNAAGMKLRKRARRETVSLDDHQENDMPTLAMELKDPQPNPEALCARTEMTETMRQGLARLSPKLRRAFELRELAGLSTREAAKTLGITRNTLKSRVVRARANLSLLVHELAGIRPAGRTATVVTRGAVGYRRRRSSAREGGSPTALPFARRQRVERRDAAVAHRTYPGE